MLRISLRQGPRPFGRSRVDARWLGSGVTANRAASHGDWPYRPHRATGRCRGRDQPTEVSDVQRMTWRDVEWLSEAADDPAECRATWANDPRLPYPLATGRCFDVVTVDQRLGIETFDLLGRRGLPLGPAVLDRAACRVGFLLRSLGVRDFARLLALEPGPTPPHRTLGPGSVVVVPGPMPLPGDRYAWLNAPGRRPWAHPLGPAALAATLVAAAETLARLDGYGEARHQVA
ncbi:bifunctional DNA primase/polymerase [Streptomyces sp. NPDC048290]|uniref:bifunctional DNA primase/polymerase n=1 Tax=Streptomyces sp. NPDC048290 TaxID=3155811 RepID=UPI003447899F